MKARFWITAAVGIMLAPCVLIAQTPPAGAPAGATGQCKDGTYTTATTKKGICQGHQGLGTWYGGTTPAPASTPQPVSQTAGAKPAQPTAAPGGGPGLVWVNTSSNVYHCYGTKYYGTTKSGKYMTEADAKAAGARPNQNKPCSK